MTELGELRKHYRKILDAGVQVVAVSVDPPATSEKLRRRLDLDFTFVCDEAGTLMDVLGIRHQGGLPPAFITGVRPGEREHDDIFAATTYLLDEEGRVRWVSRPESYRVRAPVREVLRAIEGLSRR